MSSSDTPVTDGGEGAEPRSSTDDKDRAPVEASLGTAPKPPPDDDGASSPQVSPSAAAAVPQPAGARRKRTKWNKSDASGSAGGAATSVVGFLKEVVVEKAAPHLALIKPYLEMSCVLHLAYLLYVVGSMQRADEPLRVGRWILVGLVSWAHARGRVAWSPRLCAVLAAGAQRSGLVTRYSFLESGYPALRPWMRRVRAAVSRWQEDKGRARSLAETIAELAFSFLLVTLGWQMMLGSAGQPSPFTAGCIGVAWVQLAALSVAAARRRAATSAVPANTTRPQEVVEADLARQRQMEQLCGAAVCVLAVAPALRVLPSGLAELLLLAAHVLVAVAVE